MRVWPALRFNRIVLGLTRAVRAVRRGRTSGSTPLAALLRAQPRPAGRRVGADPWTDDHAPVEWITDRMIVEYAARGGDLDEAPLPTAPA